MNMKRTVSDRSDKSRTGKGFMPGLPRWAGGVLGALAVSAVAIASVAQAPSASAATRSPAPSSAAVAHTASGLSPAQKAAAGVPRGIVYPIGRAPRAASRPTSSNPNCSTCAPPLAFAANDPVAGGVSGTPGHVTITPIFWAPAGYSFPALYNSTIDQYLADVAAASGTNGNVFSVADEYYQQLGANPKAFISYHVTAGTEVDANDAYPAQGGVSGCTAESGFGLTACVTDGALQTEVASVLSAHSLTANDSHIYMVFFPPNVQTCMGPGSPTTIGCSFSGYGPPLVTGSTAATTAGSSQAAIPPCTPTSPFHRSAVAALTRHPTARRQTPRSASSATRRTKPSPTTPTPGETVRVTKSGTSAPTRMAFRSGAQRGLIRRTTR
jgi:hypothetical protein